MSDETQTPQAPQDTAAPPQPVEQQPVEPESELAFTNYMRGVELLHKLEATLPARNHAERIAKNDRLNRIKGRIVELQNPRPAPITDIQALRKLQATAIANAEAQRNQEREACKTILESGRLATEVFFPSRQIDPALSEALALPDVQESIRALYQRLLEYQLDYIERFMWANPRTRLAELKSAFNSPTATHAQRVEMNREAAELSTGHSHIITVKTCEDLFDKFTKTVKPLVKSLLLTVAVALSRAQLAAIDEELELLERHGIDFREWKPSTISLRYKTADAEVKHALTLLDYTQCVPTVNLGTWAPSVHNTALTDVFGIAFNPCELIA